MNGGLFDREPREHAATEVRSLVRRAAVQAFGATVSTGPVEGRSVLTRPVLDDPLCGVRAARLVFDVATAQLREWALRVRGAGSGWDEVADALGLTEPDADGRMPGEVAWEWLVEHRPPGPVREHFGWRASATWTCTTCRAEVRDNGPYESPDDNESGHAPSCTRHAVAVATWRRESGFDDEEEDQ